MAIAKLSIDIEAKFAKLEKDLQTFSGRAAQIGGNLKAVFSGIAGAVGGVAIVSTFKGIVDGLDKIDEAAERLSTTTETLSTLAYAAKLNGIEFEELNKGLGKFTGLLADAKSGNEDAITTLDRLGVSAASYSNVEVAFNQAANGISGIADPVQRAGALIDVFGEKLGLKFGPMLANGAAGIAAYRAELERLGGVIGGNVARQAAEFNDNLDRLNIVSGAAGKTIAGDVLPVLNKLAEELIKTNGASTSLASGMASGVRVVFETVAVVGANVAYVFNAIGREIGGMAAQLVALAKFDFKGFSNIGAAMREDAAQARADIDALSARLLDRTEGAATSPKPPSISAQNVAPKVKRSRGVAGGKESAVNFRDADAILIERVASAIESTDLVKAAELEATLRKLDEIAAAGLDPAIVKAVRDDLTGASKLAADEVERLNAMLEATDSSQLEKARDDMLLLTRALEEGRISEEKYIEAAGARLDKTGAQTDKVITDMDKFAESAAKNIQSSLADFLFDPFANGVKGMGDQFVSMIQRMIAEAAAAQIAKSLFGDMLSAGSASSKGGSAGSGDSGLIGAAVKFVGSFFETGGVMTSAGPMPLRTYSSGGIANSPQLAMFGEGRTPEAYVPLPDGRNIPVKMHGAGAGGTTINQTIYAGQGADSAQVRRSAAAGARAALGAMSGARRYG